MIRKSILILLSGFAIQFLFSCEKCGPNPTFEMVHTGLILSMGAEEDNQFF